MENRKDDTAYFFLLNVCSSFLLSAAHNVLFVVLDLRSPVIHFLHYFVTFLFMLLLYSVGCIPKSKLPIQQFKLPVLCKLIETVLSSIVHSQNRTGGLYLTRIFDFVFTLTILMLAKKVVTLNHVKAKPNAALMISLGLSSSLAWLELGQLEYTTFSFICAPLLALFRGLSLLLLLRSYQKFSQGNGVHLEQFCMYYTGLVSCALLLPAFVSYLNSHVEVTASWESIDYTLMCLSLLFMSSALYSELWLALNVSPRVFATLEHAKFLGASIGQGIIQNMASASVIAFCGKLVAAVTLLRICATM